MSGYVYLTAGLEGMRATCGEHCAFNEFVSLGEYLKSRDPTPRARRDEYTWTEADSKRLGVNHENLAAAWRRLKNRFENCQSDALTPGCAALIRPTWFTDQKERVMAILEKRTPHLKRGSYDSNAIRYLQEMGITITSPFLLAAEERPNADSFFEIKPGSQNIHFADRTGNILLTIPLDKTDFVEIDTALSDEESWEWSNVGILVYHTNGRQSYYVINSGRIISQQVNVGKVKF